MSSLNINIFIYQAQKTQIILLIVGKVIVLKEYLNYVDFFLKKSAAELFKHLNINKPAINLEIAFLKIFINVLSTINKMQIINLK